MGSLICYCTHVRPGEVDLTLLLFHHNSPGCMSVSPWGAKREGVL